jgi:hypothetical protein
MYFGSGQVESSAIEALRASGRKVSSWLLPASVSLSRKGMTDSFAQRRAEPRCPPTPGVCRRGATSGPLRHPQIVDAAQRARLGVEHQQARFRPQHFPPLPGLQQVREVTAQEAARNVDPRFIHRRLIEADAAVIRLDVGGHVQGIRQHVEHIPLHFLALAFAPGRTLLDHHARGFHRDREQHTRRGLRAAPRCGDPVGSLLAHADAFAHQALDIRDRHQQQQDQATDYQ